MNSPSVPTRSADDEVSPEESRGVLRRLKQDTLSWPMWLAIAYAGVVLPVLCHASDMPDEPTWQSGELQDKIGFMLGGSASFVFYPLMLYPMVCLSLLLVREKRFANNHLVRFGVFSGLLVAAWYCIVLGLILFNVPALWSVLSLKVLVAWAIGIVVPFVLWGVVRGLLWLRSRLQIPWVAVVVVSIAIVSVFAFFADPIEIMFVPVAIIFLSMILGPFLCFDAYLAMTLRLLWRPARPVRFTLLQLMAVMSWFAAFLAACRWAVVFSLEEYSKLPLEPPDNCYIATAASRGHARFVGRHTIRSGTGILWQINRQLTVLKAAELAMRALAPAFHSQIRAIYDRLGRPIAGQLTHPLLGDLAYLGLKPFEWSSYLLLACLLGRERHRIDRLYLRDESWHE